MNDRVESPESFARIRKLSEAIREVKNAAADREDVVVDLREATRMRLQLLASELAPVFAEVPEELDLFDFAISSGLQPRLWIDSVAHVSMGRDRRTYRFVKDTRNGRVVLGEAVKMEPIADQVTRYIAERIVEREHLIEGDATQAVENVLNARAAEKLNQMIEAGEAEPAVAPAIPVAPAPVVEATQKGSPFLTTFAVLIAGLVFGLAATTLVFWDRVHAFFATLK